MNDFLVGYGTVAAQGTTYIVVPEAGSSVVMAYYTLWPDPPELAKIPVEDEVQVSAIWLKRLAVALVYQHQGIGERILRRIISDTLRAADKHSVIEVLMLEALDADAKAWYLRRDFGFTELAPGSAYLALSVATMRQLLILPG